RWFWYTPTLLLLALSLASGLRAGYRDDDLRELSIRFWGWAILSIPLMLLARLLRRNEHVKKRRQHVPCNVSRVVAGVIESLESRTYLTTAPSASIDA